VVHRRLRKRGVGSTDWEEFEGTAVNRSLLGRLANIEEHAIAGEDFGGIALRIYNPPSGLWSIYWVNRRDGVLGPPVVGRFSGDVGLFEGADEDAGRAVDVRFTWHRIDPTSARWSQFFSYDDGSQWEMNWIMDFSRAGDAPLKPKRSPVAAQVPGRALRDAFRPGRR
jgi:hypothetical protein